MMESCYYTVIRVPVIIIIPYSCDNYCSGGGGGSKHNDEHSFHYIRFFNRFQHNPAIGFYSKYLKLGFVTVKTSFIT